jgi:hypothetical protein
MSLYRYSGPSLLKYRELFPQSFEILSNKFGQNNVKGCQTGDEFYVPQRFASNFIKYSEEFFQAKVIHEIAMINIFTLVAASENCEDCWDELCHLALWHGNRLHFEENVMERLKNDAKPLHCVHPLKLSGDTAKQMNLLKRFFCDEIHPL